MKKFTYAGWQTKCALIAAALLVQSCSPMPKQQHDATFASDVKQQDETLADARGGHEDADTGTVLAQNDAQTPAEFSSSVSNKEMGDIRGGSDTLVINSQNGIVSDNVLSGNFTTGDNIINNSFNNSTFDGQVVMVSGNQNSVNVSTMVNVTIENMPAAR